MDKLYLGCSAFFSWRKRLRRIKDTASKKHFYGQCRMVLGPKKLCGDGRQWVLGPPAPFPPPPMPLPDDSLPFPIHFNLLVHTCSSLQRGRQKSWSLALSSFCPPHLSSRLPGETREVSVISSLLEQRPDQKDVLPGRGKQGLGMNQPSPKLQAQASPHLGVIGQ